MTQHVQAEAIEKSNSFEKESISVAEILRAHHAHMLSNANSEGLSKLHPQNLKFFNQSSPNGKMENYDNIVSDDGKMEQNEAIKAFMKMAKMANNYDVVSDDGKMEQNEFIKAFSKVSIKDTIVSNGNDTETSSFSVINSENKVKYYNFLKNYNFLITNIFGHSVKQSVNMTP